jgi:hypothetical protein
MKKLLKEYGLNSDMQYFELIAESFLNGQRSQAIEQFKAMPKSYKIAMLKTLSSGNWQTTITDNQRDSLFDAL